MELAGCSGPVNRDQLDNPAEPVGMEIIILLKNLLKYFGLHQIVDLDVE
jgi:hypothetical protein